MTDTTAPIRDNSTHTIRVQWRNTRDATPDELESALRYAPTFRYTVHQWDDTDKDGTRVTLSRFINKEGRTVDLFATYYYTRVPCARCESSWAERYVQITEDGQTSGEEPLCGTHLLMERTRISRAGREGTTITVIESEPLRIGQH